MLKKIAFAGLFVVSMIGVAGSVAAKSAEKKGAKPVVTQPAPQGLCPNCR
jgi:hypothetical protein